jgi:hypothetical protein
MLLTHSSYRSTDRKFRAIFVLKRSSDFSWQMLSPSRSSWTHHEVYFSSQYNSYQAAEAARDSIIRIARSVPMSSRKSVRVYGPCALRSISRLLYFSPVVRFSWTWDEFQFMQTCTDHIASWCFQVLMVSVYESELNFMNCIFFI